MTFLISEAKGIPMRRIQVLNFGSKFCMKLAVGDTANVQEIFNAVINVLWIP